MLDHILRQEPPKLNVARDPEFYTDLLITDLAQRLCNFHYRVIKGSDDVPLLDAPDTPRELRERYRTVVKQAVALLEFGACEGEEQS